MAWVEGKYNSMWSRGPCDFTFNRERGPKYLSNHRTVSEVSKSFGYTHTCMCLYVYIYTCKHTTIFSVTGSKVLGSYRYMENVLSSTFPVESSIQSTIHSIGVMMMCNMR